VTFEQISRLMLSSCLGVKLTIANGISSKMLVVQQQ
jgi:hypothetical protein